jgi:hypothetical protein
MAKLTVKELAQAVRDEQMSFEDALFNHLLNNLCISIEDVALFMGLTLAIGWAQLGRWHEIIELPSGPATVVEIIQRFQLQAFLENKR